MVLELSYLPILKKMNTCILGKIKDLLPQGSIDVMTKLVLVNAVYFKGNWEKKFPKEATEDGQFKLNKVRFLALVVFFILSCLYSNAHEMSFNVSIMLDRIKLNR